MIDIISIGSFIGVLAGDPTKFALTVTFANLIEVFGFKYFIKDYFF